VRFWETFATGARHGPASDRSARQTSPKGSRLSPKGAPRASGLGTFHGSWARTGDRYVRGEEGYFTYAGRSDDMLKVGGIWVSPFEVESALAEHDSVLEAAVVGHPDAEGLITPRAFVVLAEGHSGSDTLVAELQAFVRSKIALYKYPRWVEFTTELPKTATGKVQRFKLRAISRLPELA